VTTAREIQDELRPAGRRLRAAIPEVYAGYAALQRAAMTDGALPAKVKELIALAISATRECDGCVVEVAEAMGVVISMNGGPGTVWGPRAYAAFEEFAGPGGVSPRGS